MSGALPEYPADHPVGMGVPKGGSDCSKCRYYTEAGEEGGNGTCGNALLTGWLGSTTLPEPPDQYCCDFFDWRLTTAQALRRGSGFLDDLVADLRTADLATNETPANPDTIREFAPRGPDDVQLQDVNPGIPRLNPGIDEVIPPHSQIGDPRARGAAWEHHLDDLIATVGRPGDTVAYVNDASPREVLPCAVDLLVVALHPEFELAGQQIQQAACLARLVVAWWVDPPLKGHAEEELSTFMNQEAYGRHAFAHARLAGTGMAVRTSRGPVQAILMRGAIPPTLQPDINQGPGMQWNNPKPGEEDQVSPEPFIHDDFDQRWPEDTPPAPPDDPLFNMGPKTLEVSSPNDQEPLNLDPITDNQGARPHDRFLEDGGAPPGGTPGGKGRPLDLPGPGALFPPFHPDDPEIPGVGPGKSSGELP